MLKPKSQTGMFFKYLYLVITTTDILVCVSIFPMIEAIFSDHREGILSKSEGLCRVWAILWGCTIPQMTIFLVGMLSISRLLVLWNPTMRLVVTLSHTAPLSVFVTIVITYSTLLLNSTVYPKYIPNWVSCHVSSFNPHYPNKTVTQQDMEIGIYLILIPLNVIPALSLLPIGISFTLSLIRLRGSGTRIRSINNSAMKHQEAAKTVLAVTMVYLLLNFPYAGGMMMALRACILGSREIQSKELNITAREYQNTFQLPTERYLITNYLVPLTSVLFVGLNSLLNPLIYFWRINEFKKWVVRIFTRKKPVVAPIPPSRKKSSINPSKSSTITCNRNINCDTTIINCDRLSNSDCITMSNINCNTRIFGKNSNKNSNTINNKNSNTDSYTVINPLCYAIDRKKSHKCTGLSTV